MAGPIDPRLLRASAPARRHLIGSVLLAVLEAVCTAAFAVLSARVVAGAITDPVARSVSAWVPELVLLAAAAAGRVCARWAQARLGRAAAGDVVDDLRAEVVRTVTGWDPVRRRARAAELRTVLTGGLDGLVPYLAGYVPAVATAVVVTPVLLAVVALVDPLSGVVVAVTLPLIPVFMVLIGLLTRERTAARHRALTRLSDRTLDLLAGIPTLVALGRQRGPERQLAAVADAHRRTAMGALRIAFLSSMVLEMLATLCVALVAVGVGLRLQAGRMELSAGLAALILAPDVYLPLRVVGARFHESEDGALAADRAFGIIGDPMAPVGTDTDRSPLRPVADPSPRGPVVCVESLGVRGRDGLRPGGLDLRCDPGTVTVLTGGNGTGKSTALLALLGLVDPDRLEGRITVDGVGIDRLDRQRWWATVAWQPQRPTLLPGTLERNAVEFGADRQLLAAAAGAAGLDVVLRDRPRGWDEVIGAGGAGLSQGERQRLALTRALARPATMLIFDEPTAHLDAATAATVIAAIEARARGGATVLVVSHDPRLLNRADRVVTTRAVVGT